MKKINNNANVKAILNSGLYLIATPIGNLGDISKRALETLENCDLLLAEDTRVTKKLLSHYGINTKIIRADEETTEKAASEALLVLKEGGAVGFASDAGTPSISDPGQRLSEIIINNNHEVYALPGASSVLNGLCVSGFDCRQFAFLGFAPNKQGARKEFLENATKLPLCIVFFETGPRLIDSLKDISDIFPNRRICVARELTKFFEEKQRGNSKDIYELYKAKGAPKGEIVIIIEKPMDNENIIDKNDLENEIKSLLEIQSVKDTANDIAKKYKLNKREIYDMALKFKDEK